MSEKSGKTRSGKDKKVITNIEASVAAVYILLRKKNAATWSREILNLNPVIQPKYLKGMADIGVLKLTKHKGKIHYTWNHTYEMKDFTKELFTKIYNSAYPDKWVEDKPQQLEINDAEITEVEFEDEPQKTDAFNRFLDELRDFYTLHRGPIT